MGGALYKEKTLTEISEKCSVFEQIKWKESKYWGNVNNNDLSGNIRECSFR